MSDAVEKAARVWAFRTRAEHDAARRFARLADRLAGGGAVGAVVSMAREAAADELRHAERCAALRRHFGGSSPKPSEHEPSEPAPSGLSARERILYEVVAMSCITETLSAALLGEMVDRATDALVRNTVHEILTDEVQHSRLGWAHLAAEHAKGGGAFLGAYLPAMLDGTVTAELFTASDDAEAETGEALAGLGALGRRDRASIFVRTMQSVVFPGLERFGVDASTGARWIEERMTLPPKRA